MQSKLPVADTVVLSSGSRPEVLGVEAFYVVLEEGCSMILASIFNAALSTRDSMFFSHSVYQKTDTRF